MTRKDILKKYGFSWMSNVNLKEELSEQAGDTKHNHRDMANSTPASCDFSVCFTHSKGDRKMVGQEENTVARRAAPEDRRKI